MTSPLPRLYLASASPRRRELLTQLGYPFVVLTVHVPEELAPGESAVAYVQRLAQDKALAGWHACDGRLPVLGSDTIVVLDDAILEKPTDEADARRMLSALSGRTHQVMTAVALAGMQLHLVTTQVTFRSLSATEITEYWHTGEPADKAGAYGIQGIAGKFVSRIEGSYTAVVGLPLLETDLLLQQHL